jgi:hypothetical protein
MPDKSFKSGKPPANVAIVAKEKAALESEHLDLAALTAIEIERRETFKREALEAAGDPEKLAAIGAKEVRFGTGLRVVRRREPNPDKNQALIEGFARINAHFAMGPQSLDELIADLRADADEVYADYGLLAGAADHANLGVDHPVSHAGRLHSCALMLEAAAMANPVDVFQIAIRAMAAQSAADTLHAVTAKRRASGLTDAQAVFRGDENKAKTRKGGKRASEAKLTEGETNRSRVLSLARGFRESKPAETDGWLVVQIEIAIKSKYPVAQQLKRSTIETHVRALKKSGDLPPRIKS